MKNKTALEFINVSKTYRSGFLGEKKQSLKNLTLSVPTGSVFGFLGANGAGKTTTIKITLGLQKPTSGEVIVLGKSNSSNKAKTLIGYLPERPTFHLDLTGNEFLNFHRNLFGNRIQDKPQLSNSHLLNLVGIPQTASTLLREFSKGMLQRIGIAQALINSPDLVILDEPMSGLDPIGRRDVREIISQLAHEGKTIFFSSHILNDVESLCDQIAFLQSGELKVHGKINDILKKRSSKEIIFKNISAHTIKNSPILQNSTQSGDSWTLLLHNPEHTQSTLETIWQQKGELISVTNQQISLEEELFPSL